MVPDGCVKYWRQPDGAARVTLRVAIGINLNLLDNILSFRTSFRRPIELDDREEKREVEEAEDWEKEAATSASPGDLIHETWVILILHLYDPLPFVCIKRDADLCLSLPLGILTYMCWSLLLPQRTGMLRALSPAAVTVSLSPKQSPSVGWSTLNSRKSRRIWHTSGSGISVVKAQYAEEVSVEGYDGFMK